MITYRKIRNTSITILILVLMIASCSLNNPNNSAEHEDFRMHPDPDMTVLFEKEGSIASIMWNGDQHLDLTLAGYKALGVNVGGYYHYSDDPDYSTSPDDIGYGGFAWGKSHPGHTCYWENVASTWKRKKPYEWLWGTQHWADYNFQKWADTLKAYVSANNKSAAQKKIAYLMHYVEDLGCIYHVYWPFGGTWEQICSHLKYECSVDDNWNSGKIFRKEVYPSIISTKMTGASSFANAALSTSKEIAEKCYRIVDIIGLGSPNWNNSEVYNATTLSLRKTVGYITGMLVRIAKYTGIYTDDGSGEYTMPNKNDFKYFWVYANKNDKIYCAANWYQKVSGDIDIFIWSNNGHNYVAHSTSSNNPEELQYVATKSGWYAICVKADKGVSGSTVGVNAIVIKKKSFGYLFD